MRRTVPSPNQEAIERRIPDGFGYACAEALGVDAYCPLPPGWDGKVFLCEPLTRDDILIMKITTSAAEATLCKAIAEEGAVSGLFGVREVRSVTLEDGSDAWAILREDAEEVFQNPGPEDAYAVMAWREAATRFDGGWYLQDDAILASALEKAPPEARLDKALEGLRWLQERFGALGRDLHIDNFGRARDGHVCVRDLSRFRVPAAVVEAVVARIEPLEPTSAPRP